MALFEKAIPSVLRWEGGFVDDPDDPGGMTNRGIILLLFQQEAPKIGMLPDATALKNLTEAQAMQIYKNVFWGRLYGDQIYNQSLANLFLDSTVNLDELNIARGGKTLKTVKMLQEIVNTSIDGIMGPGTLAAVNNSDQQITFQGLKDKRITYYKDLVVRKPVLGKFLNGWLKRVNSYTFQP